jgi:hypothetical protein
VTYDVMVDSTGLHMEPSGRIMPETPGAVGP